MDDELQEALDAALESGDAAEIDKVIAQIDALEDGDDDNEAVTPPAKSEIERTGDDDKSVTREHAQQSVESQQEQEVIQQVVVQEQELTEQQQAKDAEAQQQMQEMQARIELLTSQLKDNGLDPKKLAHEIQLDDDELKELEGDLEELGTLGVVTHKTAMMLKHMQQRIDALQNNTAPAPTEKANSQQSTLTPQQQQQRVNEAINATEGMADILANDALREKAVQLDEQLKKDPAFASKTLEQRFAEVVKRMDIAPVKASKSEGFKDSIVPNSLGSAGNNNDAPLQEQLANLSPDELDAYLAKASQAEIDQLFENL